jgi:hypothetical protein
MLSLISNMSSQDRFAIIAQKFNQLMEQNHNPAESEAGQSEYSMEAEILMGQELNKVQGLSHVEYLEEFSEQPNELLQSVAPKPVDE